jgi:hypothetical protein
MKYIRLLFVLTLSIIFGCTFSTREERLVEKTFKTWKDAIVKGDFNTVFNLMSNIYKSSWLFLVFSDLKSNMAKKWYVRLPENLVSDFDTWLKNYRANRELYSTRTCLPTSILGSKWLFNLLKEQFDLSKSLLKREFSTIKIISIACEAKEASIVVKSLDQQIQIYTAILEEGTWKIDGFIPSPIRR